MTPRQRVERALAGRPADRVPFTMYHGMARQCAAERELRNRGLCIVKGHPVFRTHRPNVRTTQTTYHDHGTTLVRTVHETPAGRLEAVAEPADFTSWQREYLFKGPDDYKALLSLIRDERYEPDYEAFAAAEADFGHDAIFRAGIALEPLQKLVSGQMIRMQDFCIEWMERRDEILKLYDALVANRRKMYPLVAASPAGHANYGGNVVPEITGPEVFREYYLPHYHEAAEVLHRHGKLIGCHYDANCRLLADAIAETDLDYIEAFTPAPDTDMTLSEARAAWPDKVLWLNFPSSLHLADDAEVAAATADMLASLERPDGVIMGITEDIPPHRWQDSCRAIMDGLDRHAADNPHLYAP